MIHSRFKTYVNAGTFKFWLLIIVYFSNVSLKYLTLCQQEIVPGRWDKVPEPEEQEVFVPGLIPRIQHIPWQEILHKRDEIEELKTEAKRLKRSNEELEQKLRELEHRNEE